MRFSKAMLNTQVPPDLRQLLHDHVDPNGSLGMQGHGTLAATYARAKFSLVQTADGALKRASLIGPDEKVDTKFHEEYMWNELEMIQSCRWENEPSFAPG